MPKKSQKPKNSRPRLIGVLHLPPLPGAPGTSDIPAKLLREIVVQTLEEAKILQKAGFDALIVENFGDMPFYKNTVPPETIAAMAIIASDVNTLVDIPVGINVLRNDAHAALAIAAVAGCAFIRVNILSGVAAADQGLIEGQAATLLRERNRLFAPVEIFADIHVKHASSLSSSSMEIAVEEAALRAMADAVIVTGLTTGRPVELEILQQAAKSARTCKVPLYVGSGTTPENLPQLLAHADGVIVGSYIRKDGKAGASLDSQRIKKFVQAFRAIKD